MPTHFRSPSSSSCDEDEVDAIVFQALDLVALEHIASLNTSHLPSSPLPPDLSSRFRNLKSLPQIPHQAPILRRDASADPTPQAEVREPPHESPIPRRESSPDPTRQTVARESHQEAPIPRLEPSPDLAPRASPSPPRGRGCCFGFSPRRRKERGKVAAAWGSEADELMEELRGFSTREERRGMRRALREVDRASRETEKLVDLARQVSAKIGDLAGTMEMELGVEDIEEELR